MKRGVAQRLLLAALVLPSLIGCAVHQPFVPTIAENPNWHVSAGCQSYRYGILTDPDCDIVTGEGIAIQITRVRLLSLPPGQDNRTTIGIGLEPGQGTWDIAPPYASLETTLSQSISAVIDEAVVSKKDGRTIFPEKLAPDGQRYDLARAQQAFFRLRFSAPQDDLDKGFLLRITGLHKDGAVVAVPAIRFN